MFERPRDQRQISKAADKYERLMKENPKKYFFALLDNVLSMGPDLKIETGEIIEHINKYTRDNYY